MNYHLKDKVVLVTGAARGLGKAIAEKFLLSEATVILTDIDDEQGNKTLQDLSYQDSARYYHMDISHEDEVKARIDEIVKQYGKIDYVVNNAAFTPPSTPLHKTETGIIKKAIDVNILGTYYCMKHVIKHMIEQKHGVIVNISSIATINEIKGMSAYSASKHGILGLTKSAALDYAQNNIRINTVCPGMIHSDAMCLGLTEENKIYKNWIPSTNVANPMDVANAVIWLCSDEAVYATGTTMVLDGGATI